MNRPESVPIPWDAHFYRQSPLFEPLIPAFQALQAGEGQWPSLEQLNRVAESRSEPHRTAGGSPVRFVPQGNKPQVYTDRYEPRIYTTGEVQTRTENWHDLFNALAWLTFPRSKARLNQRHVQAFEEELAQGTANRGPVRDTLTLFDEDGLVVVSTDDSLLQLLRDFQWKRLFWERRSDVLASMRFFAFGHALYEKALRPFVGLTARCVVFTVPSEFLELSPEEQTRAIDQRLGEHVCNRDQFLTPQELAPLPVLGVPGWCDDNRQENYYDNTEYFRPGRTMRRKKPK